MEVALQIAAATMQVEVHETVAGIDKERSERSQVIDPK